MYLKRDLTCDVLVMGAGLAGIMAALSAAETGAKVCVVSSTRVCSGSSFYPGTWGLGLVGPENREDEEDMERTILSIGEGMADPILVHTLVSGIQDGIEYLKQLGVTLKEAQEKGQKEFIPCFDHKNRDWHGIVKESAKPVLLKRLKEQGVLLLENTEIIDIVQEEKITESAGSRRNRRVTGVIAISDRSQIRLLSCKSLVIAAGGMGGLYKYCLNTDDVTGMGQYLALKAGAELINIEFMQMMPGFVSPASKTIYNEKVFSKSEFLSPSTGKSIFDSWDKDVLSGCMEIRSTHGPFTTRLLSAPVDIRLFEEFLLHPEGVRLRYRTELHENQPEFVKTYFEWLLQEKHLTIDDPVNLGIFAHASNGGIRIDAHGFTGVPGLYACGEATGGMHGADRLGGLSTANALVFGRLAGRQASLSAKGVETGNNPEAFFEPVWYGEAPSMLRQLRKANFEDAMILRDQNRCRNLTELCCDLETELKKTERLFTREDEADKVRISARMNASLCLTRCLAGAIGMRKESRGSHYRADAPTKDERYAARIVTGWDGEIWQHWEELCLQTKN